MKQEKKCTVCKRIKRVTEFNTRAGKSLRWRSECKRCQYQRQIRNRNKNRITRPPYKDRCYSNLRNAIKRGQVIKSENCEDCGSEKYIEGHHEDYQDQLNVKWLCRKCHNAVHRKKRQA